jgi:hypothetical protein
MAVYGAWFVGALLVGTASAAADAPKQEKGAASVAPNARARLEALVRDMATGQQGAAAPTPQQINEDVVILEGSERRRLQSSCRCDEYRNGASSGSAVCNKVESGRRVCSPQMSNGACGDATATACAGSGANPAASPAPTFFDAEPTEAEQVYLNVDLRLQSAEISSASQLPSAAQFVQALAKLTGAESSSINVNATLGVPAGVRSSAAVEQPSVASQAGATVTLRATFAANDHPQREALEAQLQLSDELRGVHHHTFHIAHVHVHSASRHPLVCSTEVEGVKAEAATLLRQLAALKQTEVDLTRRGLTQSFGAPVVDESLLQRMARTLNVQVPPIRR